MEKQSILDVSVTRYVCILINLRCRGLCVFPVIFNRLMGGKFYSPFLRALDRGVLLLER